MRLALIAALATLIAAPALAQTPSAMPPPTSSGASPPMAAPAKPSKVERTAKSKECSQQADAQNLHGKARKKFRSACKAGRQG